MMNEKWKPERKVGGAAAIGLPLGVITAWAFVAATGIEVPATVATAWGSLLTAVLAYVIPNR